MTNYLPALLLVGSLVACQSTPASDSPTAEATLAESAHQEEVEGVIAQPLYPANTLEEVACGTTSAILDARLVLVRSKAQWELLWREHGRNMLPAPALPAVDFEQWTVVGFLIGLRESGGFAARIVSCSAKGDALVVRCVETRPADGQLNTMAMTSPYHFVRIPRSAAGLELQLVRE